jgi:hypothetical protein
LQRKNNLLILKGLLHPKKPQLKSLHSIFNWFRFHLEAFVWIVALVLLGFMSPDNTQATLCLWHYAGFDSCPGCGLGHSISAAFRGDFLQSLSYHPLGVVAIVVLTMRVVRIFISNQLLFSPKTSIYHDKDL